MNIDWKIVGIGLIITGILVAIFDYVSLAYLAAIIGGLITGYMITGKYVDGAVNGGLAAGISGCVYLLVFALLFERNIISVAIVAAIGVLVIYFIIGAIGGMIGVFIKGKTN